MVKHVVTPFWRPCPCSNHSLSPDCHRTSVDGELEEAKEEEKGIETILHHKSGRSIEVSGEACDSQIYSSTDLEQDDGYGWFIRRGPGNPKDSALTEDVRMRTQEWGRP